MQEGDQETATRMQELALAEGALPRHLHTALFTSSMDNRLLTHRQLSRHLVSLWVTGNPTAAALLHRVLVRECVCVCVCTRSKVQPSLPLSPTASWPDTVFGV